MPTILVVDDSGVDRQIVGGLLKKQENLTIEFATNGAEAVERLKQSPVELVVSDLIMPEMNGLELVKKVKEDFPLIPIILMTSKGNEQIAVEALQSGAASYAPKSVLAQSLLDTVNSVLSASNQTKSQARLIRYLTNSQCEFSLENDSSLIPPLIGFLQEDATRLGVCAEADRVRIGVALDEALVNALYHGNLELSSQLRDSDQKKYRQLVSERQQAPPFSERRIHVEAHLSSKEFAISIRDEGPGFDSTSLPDPRDPANLEALGGRGVMLMRTFMDEVRYNDRGNQVTLVKRQNGLTPTAEDSETT
jgi:CheY-like chemotaxis protein/anti-sigma regulatory factor (Ser/Thr protein kinase)